jgi:hypothetical protein
MSGTPSPAADGAPRFGREDEWVLPILHPRREDYLVLGLAFLGFGLTCESAEATSGRSSKRSVDRTRDHLRHRLTLPVRAVPILTEIGTHSSAGQQVGATPQLGKRWTNDHRR